ncbi:hypothetical protein, partial [Marinobacterium weihaiense]
LLDELLNGVVHDVASDEPRITPLAYMIIRDATPIFHSMSSLMQMVFFLRLTGVHLSSLVKVNLLIICLHILTSSAQLSVLN